MTGDTLLDMINSRGGNPNEYSDIVPGKVISISPLKIQYSSTAILTEDFLTLGEHVTKHTVKMTYQDRSDDGEIKRTETVTIDQSLKVGDGVLMLRGDGGQRFLVLEKLGDTN